MKQSKSGVLRLIAIFKLFKASTLIAVGIGALRLAHHGGENVLDHWASTIGINLDGRYVDTAISKISSISPHKLKDLGVGSFFYAALFLTEGTGLWLMKPWAEWFTTIITASLIPLEVFEIHHKPGLAKIAVLAINVAVVLYLVLRIRRERSEARKAS
jgi:uncharacterized membrane protein (DUF2068 family)